MLRPRVTYDEIVERVGQQRYRAACECAWQSRFGDEWPDGLDMVPHDLADLWNDEMTSLAARLALALRVYREMPCYANTMDAMHFFDEYGPAEKRMLWDAYRDALDSPDDRLAEPVAYSLWVDYFEKWDTVEEAWHEMLLEPTDRRLERLLHASGPVPWKLKEPLFERLADAPRGRPFIRQALDAAESDVYGQTDPTAAEAWRRRLNPAS